MSIDRRTRRLFFKSFGLLVPLYRLGGRHRLNCLREELSQPLLQVKLLLVPRQFLASETLLQARLPVNLIN